MQEWIPVHKPQAQPGQKQHQGPRKDIVASSVQVSAHDFVQHQTWLRLQQMQQNQSKDPLDVWPWKQMDNLRN